MRAAAARRLGPALALVALVAACTHAPRRGPAEPPDAGARPASPSRGEIGLASFYGRRFHGKRTASGARYDMHGLTCAHRTAPFGARLRVTDLDTGQSVVVRVTDRGPFRHGRVVDLSLAAARRLGMVDRGVARVRVERLDDDDGSDEEDDE